LNHSLNYSFFQLIYAVEESRTVVSSGLGGDGSRCRGTKTRLFAMPFYAKNAIILPRQARDKHRESTQKERCAFFQGLYVVATNNKEDVWVTKVEFESLR
jgi:hypothetical protein